MPNYDRDLLGYGAAAPHPAWPNDARIAVQFVINFEEGGENSVLHGDAHAETFLSEIAGAEPYPMRHMSMESLYEYGTRAGFWCLHRLFREFDMPVTVFGVAMALERHPEAVAAMLDADCAVWRMCYRSSCATNERERLATRRSSDPIVERARNKTERAAALARSSCRFGALDRRMAPY